MKRAALAACLALLASPAPARDKDSLDYRDGYRRGYDDGFASGCRKELEVAYYCGPVAKTASANEHRTIHLDCTP